jgi:hypothetical protein
MARVKVMISTADGELLDIMLLEETRDPSTPARLSNAIRTALEHRFEVIEEED